MAEEEFHRGGVCGGKWWSSSRNLFGCSSPCSLGGFHPDGFTDTTKPPRSSANDHVVDNSVLMGVIGSRGWNQDCLRSRSDESYSDIMSYNHQQGLPNAFSLNNSSMLQTLFDNDQLEQTLSDNWGLNCSNDRHDSTEQFLQVPPAFGDKNPPLWNTTEAPHDSTTNHNRKSPSINTKRQNEAGGSNEPTVKRTRIETPSSLPTFKVRKEKLGDRITALQQLVSPFGKTDTASVLHEAIEYIKFLHDQVSTLCTPYLKSGPPPHTATTIDRQGHIVQDLRSGGLCLVPISSTFPVADAATDFWNPSFVRTFKL